jgi:ATP-dependent Clp protease ATP-binding subunit ClpA
MIRLDMSEYQEEVSVSRLVGASPRGTWGTRRGGRLVSRLRTTPYSVVLLDEVENAGIHGRPHRQAKPEPE